MPPEKEGPKPDWWEYLKTYRADENALLLGDTLIAVFSMAPNMDDARRNAARTAEVLNESVRATKPR